MQPDAPDPALRPRALMLAGCALAVLGVGLGLGFGLQPELRARRASGWTAVEAVVRSASLEESQGDDPTCFRPVIEYTYELGPRRYTSTRYDFLDAYLCDRALAEAVLARHPPGARVTCFVDPADPSLAVLDRSPGQGRLVLVMAAAAVVLGLALIVAGVLARRRWRALILAVCVWPGGCCLSNGEVRDLVVRGEVRNFEFLHAGAFVRLQDGRRLCWSRPDRAGLEAWLAECGEPCQGMINLVE